MTEREKIDAAVAELRDRKVRATTAAPFLYRACWALGILVPPPLFQSFFGILVFQGGFIAVVTGVMLGIVTGIRNPSEWALLMLACGLFFGFLMGIYYRGFARRLGLPRWADYVPGMDEDENPDW